MLRACVEAEKAGCRSVAIVASGFLQQAKAITKALGVPDLALVEYPGVVMMDSPEVLRQKVDNSIDQIVEGLTSSASGSASAIEEDPRDVVYTGTLDEIQDFFIRNQWTDGLPIIPPTRRRVDKFMQFTTRKSDEVLGVLPVESRQATVWNVAVNGVMAGCRPEYMPLLLSIVEAIAEPDFRLIDAGSTPGWEPLIVVNGPIVKELNFNYGPGSMRVGRQANTSIGRFLRLYINNVAGFRIPPAGTDKATIGGTFNVVLAENESVVREIAWDTFAAQRGFNNDDNVVTVQSVVAISPPVYTAGENPEDHLETLVDAIGLGTCAYWSCTGMAFGRWHPLIVLSPSIASSLANHGYSKEDVQRYLYEHTHISAAAAERYAWQIGLTTFSLRELVNEGTLPEEYADSDDPDRKVPVFLRPEWIGIVVAGDPDRNQARAYVNNHRQGIPISRSIAWP